MLSSEKNSWGEQGIFSGATLGKNATPLWQSATLFGVAYFLCALLGYCLSRPGDHFVTFWLPAGLYVAVLLLNDSRSWPALALAVFPANLLFDLSVGTPLMLILFFYLLNTFQAMASASLVRRFVTVRPTMKNLRELFGVISFSAILTPLVFAAGGAEILTKFGMSSSFSQSWKIWLGSNSMAVLILTPCILVWFSDLRETRRYLGKPAKQLEGLLLIIGLTIVAWHTIYLKDGFVAPQRIWLLPFLLWAGLRFGVRGATIVNLILALLVGYFFNTRIATALLPDGTPAEAHLPLMQFSIALGSFVALLPAIVLGERDRMLVQLSESEERFRNLTRAAFEGIATIEGAVIVDGNQQLFDMFGCGREDVIGKEAIQWVAEGSRENVLTSFREENNDIHELQLRRKDGTVFHVEARGKIVHVEDRKLRMIALRDVTERKFALERIMEQAALLDETADAIIVRDMEGVILYWNKGAERMYGWPASEAIGRTTTDLLRTESPVYASVIDAVMADGKWTGQVEHKTRDGRKLCVEARLTLVTGENGAPKSILGIITDVTEKKRIEAQFLRAQRMESIGNLAGGIAHDLNNILSPIIMSIDLLRNFARESQVEETLETIHVSATRGAAIVRQVLSFARGIEGPQVDIKIMDLIKDIHHIVNDTFPKNIRLQTSVRHDVWNIQGDPTQLYQVLLNLCVNARDAMPRGGQITITVENQMINDLHAAMHLQSRVGPYVAIHVEDLGVGIPRENMEKIFEPFFTTKEVGSGSGLGLSTLLAVMKSHGGFVNVQSEPGQGTKFSLFLPSTLLSTTRPEQGPKSTLQLGNGELVLLVDDELPILNLTRKALESSGYRVVAASDGIEAITIYTQQMNAISVVITDMMMPLMDGPATIRALRKMNPLVKIIATSGLNTKGKIPKASEAGVQHFLPKPYSRESLLDMLKTVL